MNGAPTRNHPIFAISGVEIAHPPDAFVATGYQYLLGEEVKVRIYASPDLSRWLDVSSSDILAHIPGGAEGDPTTFLVRRTATVYEGYLRETTGDFVAGSIIDGGGSGPPWLPGGPIPYCSHQIRTHWPPC
jgi:hypothetical protein